ncbi:hypothetical protein CEXT_86771 [Caerostris extrusa]|uniref:Uncharacterized protein n=1 Tax=Caerostris extrusa TaxID=172846 RepID=A0AAV4Y6E3_CAEEX|nr:hypothetical protein CEXT_86771 [Caerostris extrusa]
MDSSAGYCVKYVQFKDQAIPRSLHVCTSLLDPFCNAMTTSSTDVEAIDFLPLLDFTAKEPVSWSPLASIRPQPLPSPFHDRDFFKAAATHSHSCKRARGNVEINYT